MHYIGIDSAKATFEAALPKAKGFQVVELGNMEEGFTKLLNQLPADSHCVMEDTGPY